MSSTPEATPEIDQALKKKLIARPDVILDDKDLMGALIAANEQAMGNNIVDMRGMAMKRLETRLDRLEDTHRSVIAAAYENVAGTTMMHRAVLRLLDAETFDDFVQNLAGDVARILDVDGLRLVLESVQHGPEDDDIRRHGETLRMVAPGFVSDYVEGPRSSASRPVVLREIDRAPPEMWGSAAPYLRSEACLRLDFGPGRLPGLLILASEDSDQFSAAHGTDLLAFFAGAFERGMRRFLS